MFSSWPGLITFPFSDPKPLSGSPLDPTRGERPLHTLTLQWAAIQKPFSCMCLEFI